MTTQPMFSKSEYAYREVKRRILDDTLPAGAVVGQEHLAAELQISTTPIREALKRLAAEGLVTLATHRDARVTDLTADEARSLLEVRLELDPLAARLAAERRETADVARMEQALQDLEPLTGDSSYDALVAHRRFHQAVYTASANRTLATILDGLWDTADRYRLMGLRSREVTAQERRRVHDEHTAILTAVRDGDSEEAGRVMLTHVERSRSWAALERLSARG